MQFGNIPESTPDPIAWPLENAALYSLGWIAVILAVFVPLSIRAFQQAATNS